MAALLFAVAGALVGVLVTATAVAAWVAGLTTDTAPSTITGVGAGLSLSLFGLRSSERAPPGEVTRAPVATLRRTDRRAVPPPPARIRSSGGRR
ncbi:hypothetical protein [Micromonospora narathiwatensis]|uniref:Uncharacterized protein n=1 Tax=Micromonospora narathiwatensis TaxID=299146 RepID=A0A1A8ZLQ9_9ACTN|nr:hypothetical protein [Micromonospora narathiwatensis]SBT44792.1 hypothetical protein GA0070621_2162 [Micromonospora narathiwatensis]